MRNLKRHPITVKEITDALERQSEELLADGDMRPLLFQTAAKIIKRAEFATHDIGMGL